MFSRQQQALADRLWAVGAIMDRHRSTSGKGFKLKLHEREPDAPLSPIYLNLRTPDNPKPGPLGRGEVVMVALALWDILKGFSPMTRMDHVLGIPRAGEPFADTLWGIALSSSTIPLGLLHLNKVDDTGGGSRKIGDDLVGTFEAGQSALLVDDLVTHADSKVEAASSLRQKGVSVGHVMVLVDRSQGGRQALAKHDLELHSVFTLPQLLLYYRERDVLDRETYHEIVEYLEANG